MYFGTVMLTLLDLLLLSIIVYNVEACESFIQQMLFQSDFAM